MRWDIINRLIKDYNLTSYLEIGYQNGLCFDQIICEQKYSIDPNGKAVFTGTSDEFFLSIPQHLIFDIVLIDGLHHAYQVERDIVNSINLIKARFVVLHDCLPTDEQSQRVPRETKVWFGDVWRAWNGFKQKYPEMVHAFHTNDCGIGVIAVTGTVEPGFTDYKTTFQEYLDSHSNTIPNR